jgi:hypothetical protein
MKEDEMAMRVHFLSQMKTIIFLGSGWIVKTSKQIQVNSEDAMDSLLVEE